MWVAAVGTGGALALPPSNAAFKSTKPAAPLLGRGRGRGRGRDSGGGIRVRVRVSPWSPCVPHSPAGACARTRGAAAS